MNHIERMGIELEELADKIIKASEFLDREQKEPKFLDARQRDMLRDQIEAMQCYSFVLSNRFRYDKDKEERVVKDKLLKL